MRNASSADTSARPTHTANVQWYPSSARSGSVGAALSVVKLDSTVAIRAMPIDTDICRCVEKIAEARPLSAGLISA